jgi:membrane-bound lytic murein transglycosylase D
VNRDRSGVNRILPAVWKGWGMKRVVFFGALFISVVFSSSIFSISYALTPPNPIGPKSPPIPELMPDLDSKTDNPGKISDPNSPQTRSLDLPLPLLSEENNQEKSPSDLPPVIRPSREEIKEKVILELKELERVGYDKAKISFDFPIVINDQVEYFIDYFQSKLRNRFTMWMGRSTRYMAMMQKILREHNLPEDLIYLAMIESGFSTKAYSRAHAAGPWQFIRETGARYGLQVNSWVDERKDPIKSTRAAAQHLSDLFNRFGSWYLAAAGYNAGEGKISRALAMYNASNFWEISADHCHYIKEETKQYVPKMIAAALIAKEPEKYGFSKVPYQSPLTFDEVTVPGNVELKDVAAAVGATVDTIVDLNPELKRWVTPPGTSEYIIRVPEGTRDKLLENYAQLIRPKPRVVYAEHRVKKGERLSSISKRYGVKASVILRANRIKAGNPLNAGLVLLIPKRTGAHGFPSDIESTDHENMDEKISSSRASRPRPGGKSSVVAENKAHEKNGRPLRIRYRIRKGDSLASIAEKFDVDISLIKKWNNVKGGPKIQQGKNLTLFVTKGIPDRDGHKENVRSGKLNLRKTKVESANRAKLVLYTVKRGDNLSEIAQKFNTTPNQIRTWNRLSTKGTIKPGDKLSLKIKRSTVANI